MRLTVPYGTVTYVQYTKDAKEQVITGEGMTFMRHKDITVTFSGPVVSGRTGKSFEHASYVTLERINGRPIWSVSLGTPLDAHENDRYVPEEEIPETIRTAVSTFTDHFEN